MGAIDSDSSRFNTVKKWPRLGVCWRGSGEFRCHLLHARILSRLAPLMFDKLFKPSRIRKHMEGMH